MNIVDRYSSYSVPSLSYATVRDYCDSFDHLTDLATANHDLKDVQRPWMVKAILGSLPIGSNLLEIGAGNPIVAKLLASLGYRLTIVDPYDGTGNGPLEYENFKSACPEIRFIRSFLTENLDELQPHSYDCIYSISVLEHVPVSAIASVCNGIRKFLKPVTGKNIHAVDYVLKGAGDLYNLQCMKLFAENFGLQTHAIEELFKRAEDDVETYFLSAEAHNLWRGSLRYDEFAMRRVISFQLNLRA